ncbi:MAG: PAS domain-containing protein [Thaumarchaeota archaeon]|nr:PAS domain-containing protein [Nitrososphaerota archaeon]
MKLFIGIKSKLVIVLLLISILPIALLTAIQLSIDQSILHDQTTSELQLVAKDRHTNLLQIWQIRTEQITILTDNKIIRDLVTESNNEVPDGDRVAELKHGVSKELELFQKDTGGIHGFSDFLILDKKNSPAYTSSTIDISTYPESKKSGYIITKDSRSPTKSSLILKMPIYGENTQEPIGSIFAKRDIVYAHSVLTDRAHLGQTGEAYLVNMDMKMITESRFISDAQFNQVVDTVPVRMCFEKNQNTHGEWKDYRKIPVFGASICDKENGFVLIAERDVSESLSPLILTQINSILITMSTISIVTLAGIILSNYVSNPIRKLIDAVNKMEQGEYDVQVDITRKDEIGKLAQHFNEMSKKILSTNDSINQLVQEKVAELEITNFDLKKALQDNANIQNALNESSIVAITDKDGIITYVNKQFCEISKYSEKELIGNTHRILKSGYHTPEFYQDMWRTVSSGRVWKGDVKNKAKDDTYYWVQTTIVPFLDDVGNPIQYVAIRTDITQQKTIQEERLRLERFAAIGELSSRLAHDLRNPLGVIKTTLEILKIKNIPNDEKMKELYDRMDSAIQRITHQINDVLLFVRKSPMKIEEVSMLELINSSLEKITVPKSVDVKISGNDVRIYCDATKIDAMFTNLLLNAVQAVEEDGIISIRLFDIGDAVTIEIEDSGHGIPDEILPKIFEPLFTTKQKGTGLGLASCKNITAEHKGTISVKNNPTTFIITLPKNPILN